MKNHRLHPLETLLAFVLAVLSTLAPSLLTAQAPVPDSPAIEAKAHALLSKLTLEEKIKLIGGVDSMFTNAAPSIGLPRLKMSDASVGIRTWGPTNSYAGGAALAATWDPAFAREFGASIGLDARARSVHFLLGPGVNIARGSVNGRNFEYLSEDPYLNAMLVVPWIEGVQSQGVIATVKHYALNNQEYNRHDASADVDERTMRELYLPAFEAAVVRGHVDSVMNSYNLVNGVHATQNEFLNLKVLKGEWGFKGVLMSDWDATYDGVGAANNGLDLEMPSPKFMNAETLIPAVKAGKVKESVIDDKVLRLLRTELRYGFTDRPQFLPVSTYSAAARAVALKGALESITLLKNEGKLLPLDPAKTRTIAVIGPNAWPAIVGGGGSSEATPFEASSPLTGIVNLLGADAHVLYSRGLPEIDTVFHATRWNGDVKMEIFANHDFSGDPAVASRRVISSFKPGEKAPEGLGLRSVRYTASYTAKDAGSYLIVTNAPRPGTYKVSVDGKQVAEQIRSDGHYAHSASITLAAGQTIQVQADYIPYASTLGLDIGIAYEPALISEEAVQFAKLADAVVVAVGFDPHSESEGHDRTFALPWGQDALIRDVAAVNPHTIVTLNAGGAADTRSWLDKVPAFLHLYYPGEEGGTALAQILFGKHSPEGKLPASFERSWDESPAAAWYYGKPGTETKLHVEEYGKKPVDLTIEHTPYGDKLMVGYRYWTTTGKHPLYPFGFGLSYTTFGFSNLKVNAKAKAGSTVDVAFDVTNSGSVAGAEVAQLYVSDPSAKADRPERELKGFAKVNLAPGETKHLTLSLDARAFSYWSEAKKGWTIDPGKFVVRVGNASDNTPLSADLTLE
ncbi:MAG: glycoside hydrolase family 3 C-terminal domain-containing protein [Terracidiphilus sp.]|nr:glycoside hydrolase family 3 C-terminal domain-containing protein [Terracidiphilus sp.]